MAAELRRPPILPGELPPTLTAALDRTDELDRYRRLADRLNEILVRQSQLAANRNGALLTETWTAAQAANEDKPQSEEANTDDERELLLSELEDVTLALARARQDLMRAARSHAQEQINAARERADGALAEAREALDAAKHALDRHADASGQMWWWRSIRAGRDPGRLAAPKADSMIVARLTEVGQRVAEDQARRAEHWQDAERQDQRSDEPASPKRPPPDGILVF
jgi:hypothetical protein